MKSKYSFNNPKLQIMADEIANAQFADLDNFNQDCKAVTRLLTECRVENLYWIDGDNAEYELAWHDGTIVYKRAGSSDLPENALPLYEASSKVRRTILKDELLVALLEEGKALFKLGV